MDTWKLWRAVGLIAVFFAATVCRASGIDNGTRDGAGGPAVQDAVAVFIGTGTFTASMPATQSIRLLRPGAAGATNCLTTGASPGVTGAGNTYVSSGTTHTLTSPFATVACYRFALTMTTPGCSQNVTLAAYSPSYDAANIEANLIGQGGQSTGSSNPQFVPAFSANLLPGANVVLVVASVDAGAVVGSCTYTVTAQPYAATVYEAAGSFGPGMSGAVTQTGRLTRNGAGTETKCSTTGQSPGLSSSTSQFASTGSTHSLVNPFETRQCMLFSLAPNTPTCAQNMTAAAYSPTYDSANPLTNLIGQGGVSTGTTAPFGQPRFTAEVAAGAPVVLVVATVDTTLPATLCTYTVNASVPVLGKCAMDVDGDGSVVATKDGLIAARAMLGLTGAAVTNGISFSGAATRTDWTSIRRYLVNQCGMTLAP